MASEPPSLEPTTGGDSAEASSAQLRLQRRRQRRKERAERRAQGDDPERPRRTSSRRHASPAREPAAEDTSAQRRRSAGGPKPDRITVDFDPQWLDPGAEKVVRRLTSHGYEAYLVGGCVRDLLVGHRPKDFDVATNARPEEVRALFRNSRIIGRRFRLVHVLFSQGHVVETATFRRNPPQSDQSSDESLLIISDNVFGEAHEDAQRRDFTINGLFYDVDEGVVLDWVGGMRHIRSRTIQTIGDPVVRFLEDPVRMLRAVKFAARIDFGLAPEVYDAVVQCRGALAMAARPRLSEEVLRLMRGGASARSIWLLWEMGMLDILLPELSAYLADGSEERLAWEVLARVDAATKARGAPLDDVVLWSALLLCPLGEAIDGAGDRMRSAHDFLEPIVDRLNLPRRISDSVRRIVAMLPKIERDKAARFKKSALYPLALEVAELKRGAVSSPASASEQPSKKTSKRRSSGERRKRPTRES